MITPIYHELSEKLENYILDNGLTGKLPGLGPLSKKFGVHQLTMSKAVKLLEEKGMVSINGTRGTFINEERRIRPKYQVMGSWHDELVSSDHDTATVDYLQKFAERVRLVQDKEDGEIVRVKDGVPDVSYCLRQNPADGSYLLLATNNRREPVTVKFALKLENLPPVSVDFLNRRQVRLQGNTFSDKFEAFGVHAYIIKPVPAVSRSGSAW